MAASLPTALFLVCFLAAVGLAAMDPDACPGPHSLHGSGSFTDGSGASDYDAFSECTWILQADTPTSRLRLSFSEFRVEYDSSCRYDAVFVYDGASDSADELLKACGSSLPGAVESTGEFMTVKFEADSSFQDDGFEVYFESFVPILPDPACPGPLTLPVFDNGTVGTLADNSGSANYSTETYCSWVLQAPTPQHRIRLTVTYLDLEPHVRTMQRLKQPPHHVIYPPPPQPSCLFDRLEVFDGLGTDTASAGDAILTLDTLCGTLSQPLELDSSAGWLTLLFVTDEFNNFGGFDVSFSSFVLVTPSCPGPLVVPVGSGNITDGPGDHLNNLDCSWLLQALPSQHLLLNFTEHDIQAGTQGCNRDALRVYDGPDASYPLLLEYCDRVAIPPIASTQEFLFVTFHADGALTRPGFSATYASFVFMPTPSCPGPLLLTTGNTTFSSGPGLYDNNAYCSWLLVADAPHQRIRVAFPDFHMFTPVGDHLPCDDTVSVFDGPNTSAPLLFHGCGVNGPTLDSTASHVLVTMETDGWDPWPGFNATFVTFPEDSAACPGPEPVSGAGTITYGNGNYFSSSNCSYEVLPDDPTARALVWFNAMDVEEEKDCAADAVAVLGADGAVMARICGTRAPPGTFADSSLVVRFTSNAAVTATGFSFSYTSVPSAPPPGCTQIRLMDVGRLEAPPSASCVLWVLAASDPQSRIAVSVSAVDPRASPAVALDGSTMAAPVLALVGTPGVLLSSGPHLAVYVPSATAFVASFESVNGGNFPLAVSFANLTAPCDEAAVVGVAAPGAPLWTYCGEDRPTFESPPLPAGQAIAALGRPSANVSVAATVAVASAPASTPCDVLPGHSSVVASVFSGDDFELTNQYTVFDAATRVRALRVGDFDGDGDSDMVSGGEAGVLLHENVGGFGAAAFGATHLVSASETTSLFLAVGDVDDDGDPDIVEVHRVRSSVSVLEWFENVGGVGGGTISSAPHYLHEFESGLNVLSIELVDATSDGTLDIVMSTACCSGVRVTESNAEEYVFMMLEGIPDSNLFKDPTSFFQAATGYSVADICTVDIDGDGDVDIGFVGDSFDVAVDTAADETVIQWLENSSPGWTVHTIGTLNVPLQGTVCSDVNGDGFVDLLASKSSESSPGVVLYKGTGLPGGAAFGSFGTTTSASREALIPVLSDVDGDSWVDLVFSTRALLTHRVLWRRNDGTGGWGDEQLITTAVNQATVIVAKDLDGDGDTDIATASFFSDEVAFYLNVKGVSTDAFSGASHTYPASTTAQNRNVGSGDLDGDKDVDFVLLSETGSSLLWLENKAAAGMELSPNVVASGTHGDESVGVGDITGDGVADVAFSSPTLRTIRWAENDGLGAFVHNHLVSGTEGDGAFFSAVADLDNDGDLDVLTYLYFAGDIVMWPNNGTTISGNAVVLANHPHAESLRFEDINSDSSLDIILCGVSLDNTLGVSDGWAGVVEQTSPGVFGAYHTVFEGSDLTDADYRTLPLYDATVADVDDDGVADVIAAGSDFVDKSRVMWFRQGPNRTWGGPNLITSAVPGSFAVLTRDADLDGKLDLFVAGVTEGTIQWFAGANQGFSTSPNSVAAGSRVSRLLDLQDVDGDSSLDLVTVHTQGSVTAANVVVYPGQASHVTVSDAPGGVPTIQAALEAAVGLQGPSAVVEVLLPVALPPSPSWRWPNRPLTVRGTNETHPAVLSCPTPGYREAVDTCGGGGGSLTFQDVVFVGCSQAGLLRAVGARVTLRRVVFRGVTPDTSGRRRLAASPPSVVASALLSVEEATTLELAQVVTLPGSGVGSSTRLLEAFSSSVIMTASRVEGDAAGGPVPGSGGCVVVTGSGCGTASLTVTGTSFTACHASGDGGALYVTGAGLSMASAAVHNCSSGGNGGGVHATAPTTLFLSRTSVLGGVAADSGGGLHIASTEVSTELVVDASVLEGEASGGNGGGLHWAPGDTEVVLSVVDSVVSGSAPSGGGGALYVATVDAASVLPTLPGTTLSDSSTAAYGQTLATAGVALECYNGTTGQPCTPTLSLQQLQAAEFRVLDGFGSVTAGTGLQAATCTLQLPNNTAIAIASAVEVSVGGVARFTAAVVSGEVGATYSAHVLCSFPTHTLPPATFAVSLPTCEAGFAPASSRLGCLPCPVGTSSNGTKCVACPAGQIAGAQSPSCEQCADGEEPNSDLSDCRRCDAGSYGVNGRCEACPPGNYSSVTGSTSCTECPVNTWNDQPRGISPSACQPCTLLDANKVTVAAGQATSAACVCKAGFYFDPVTAACVACDAFMLCVVPGVNVTSLELQPGFWRASPTSSSVLECRVSGACVGGTSADSVDALCRSGNHGPLCELCRQGFVSGDDDLCTECSEGVLVLLTPTGVLVVVLGCLVLAAAAAVVVAHKACPHRRLHHMRPVRLLRAAVNVWTSGGRTVYSGAHGDPRRVRTQLGQAKAKAKIAVAFAQVAVIVILEYSVDYGSSPTTSARWFEWTNLSLFTLFVAGCDAGDLDQFDKLLAVVVTPLLILTAVTVAYIVVGRVARIRPATRAKWRRWCVVGALVLLFFVYPGVCQEVVKSLRCLTLETGEFLRADVSISCASNRYYTMRAFAVSILAAIPVGVPVLFFVLLHRHRHAVRGDPCWLVSVPDGRTRVVVDTHRLQSRHHGDVLGRVAQCLAPVFPSWVPAPDPESGAGVLRFTVPVVLGCRDVARLRTNVKRWVASVYSSDMAACVRQEDASVTHLTFLFEDYVPRLWMMESIELTRKFLLTGVALLFPEGSLSQPLFATLVAGVYVVLYVRLQPWESGADNAVALIAQTCLLMLVVFGHLLSLTELGVLDYDVPTLRAAASLTVWLVPLVAACAILYEGVNVAWDAQVATRRSLPPSRDHSSWLHRAAVTLWCSTLGHKPSKHSVLPSEHLWTPPLATPEAVFANPAPAAENLGGVVQQRGALAPPRSLESKDIVVGSALNLDRRAWGSASPVPEAAQLGNGVEVVEHGNGVEMLGAHLVDEDAAVQDKGTTGSQDGGGAAMVVDSRQSLGLAPEGEPEERPRPMLEPLPVVAVPVVDGEAVAVGSVAPSGHVHDDGGDTVIDP